MYDVIRVSLKCSQYPFLFIFGSCFNSVFAYQIYEDLLCEFIYGFLNWLYEWFQEVCYIGYIREVHCIGFIYLLYSGQFKYFISNHNQQNTALIAILYLVSAKELVLVFHLLIPICKPLV